MEFRSATQLASDGSKVSSQTASSVQSTLPSFLIVGPPRTGSSWVHEVLSKATNLPSPTKETRFFDSHYQRGLNWYRHHFSEAVPGRILGEVAPTYFSSREARERIAKTIPNAKIVFTFREPLQRALSLYRLKFAYGMVPWSMEEALDRDAELQESGKYATHLRGWLELFPKEQLLVTLYDDLRNSPQQYLDTVCSFIGIPQIHLSETELRHVHSSGPMTEPRNYVITRTALAFADWCKARKLDRVVAAVRKSRSMKLLIGGGAPLTGMSESARAKAIKLFAPEVDALETMIGRDLSSWKTGWSPLTQSRAS